jgi:hypothetical protein
VLARAGEYAASGAFPGETASRLQALAYLHLLNGVTAADAIAFARTAGTQPPGDAGRDHDRDDADPRDGQAATTNPPGTTGRGEAGTDEDDADEAGGAADSGGTVNRSDGHEPDGGNADRPGDDREPDGDSGNTDDDHGPDGDPGSGGGPRRERPPGTLAAGASARPSF